MSEVEIKYNDERQFLNRISKFRDKQESELVCAQNNLLMAVEYFKQSTEEQLRRSGLVRREARGILAVDEKGCKKRPPHLIRLYFYVWLDNEGKKNLVLLTIGDKNSQKRDNIYCLECLRKMGLK